MSNVDQNLERFINAQNAVYQQVLAELKMGTKQSHWMWFIFPQLEGLGRSATAIKYSIKDKLEAEQYLKHPVLGKRLIECCELLLKIHNRSAAEIFGYPDDLKLKSSMTLFAMVPNSHSIFKDVLNKLYCGEYDQMTIKLLKI